MLRTQPLAIVRSLTHSQRTRGPKGYSDDAAEDGFVFVPANAGAGRILADEDLSEVLGSPSAKYATSSRSGSNHSGIGSVSARRPETKSYRQPKEITRLFALKPWKSKASRGSSLISLMRAI